MFLGQVQTPYFTWAESNANEVEQRIFLICIWFGSCEVRRLNLALLVKTYNLTFLPMGLHVHVFQFNFIWITPEWIRIAKSNLQGPVHTTLEEFENRALFLRSGLPSTLIGSLSKLRRRQRRGRHQTKVLISRTIAVHVRYNSLYISLPSSAKQQREMTKFCVVWRTQTAMVNFSYLLLELSAVDACLAWVSF